MERILSPSKTIALVAHDHKKEEMIAWALRQKPQLQQHTLLATGTTGALLAKALALPVTCLLSGPLGGDQQMGARIAEGLIDMLIFFWDPMEAQPHDPDIKALLRVAVTWNIPIACNESTADFLLSSPYMQGTYRLQLPNYSAYLERNPAGKLHE